jgi:hypothetical protein
VLSFGVVGSVKVAQSLFLGVVVSEEYRLAAHPASRVPQVPPGRLSLSKQSQSHNIRQ